MLAAAVGLCFLVVKLFSVLQPLLKLLPDLLASEPGDVPDPHPPGASQGAGLGLHLLKPFWVELDELVLERLEDGVVTGGCGVDPRLTPRGGSLNKVWVLVVSVCFIHWCRILVTKLVLVCGSPTLTLLQVVLAFIGQS